MKCILKIERLGLGKKTILYFKNIECGFPHCTLKKEEARIFNSYKEAKKLYGRKIYAFSLQKIEK